MSGSHLSPKFPTVALRTAVQVLCICAWSLVGGALKHVELAPSIYTQSIYILRERQNKTDLHRDVVISLLNLHYTSTLQLTTDPNTSFYVAQSKNLLIIAALFFSLRIEIP